MRVTARYKGGERPFQGDRIIVFQALPVGARIARATISLTPAGPGARDPGRERFVERFALGPVLGKGELAGGDWGLTKNRSSDGVEVDFHARRTLAAVDGADVEGALLSVDVGGAYVDLNERGSVMTPGDNPFPVPDDHSLPGVTVAKFRLNRPAATASAPDVSTVTIRSVPSNISVGVGQLGPIWARVGDLAASDTSPDFASVLQAFLAEAEVSNGAYVVPFTVHADGISRLDATVEIEYVIERSLLPEGLEEISLPFDLSTRAASNDGLMHVSLPPEAVVVTGQTTARVRGAFDETRIAQGIKEPAAAAQAIIEPKRAQAQAVVTDSDVVATSVDLLLESLDRICSLSLTIVSDSDGKPLGEPLIEQPIDITLSRTASGAPAWVTASFQTAFRFQAERTYWLVLQSLVGRASWPAGAAVPDRPGLQSSTDEGLSWRMSTDPRVAGPLAGLFRLRVRPATFEMPLSLEVGQGERMQVVSLDRFEPLGRIDFSLGVPEVAQAVNRYVQEVGRGGWPRGELLANGEFDQWHNLGEDVYEPARIVVRGGPRAIALTPDGRWGYVGTHRTESSDEKEILVGALERVDLVCRSVGDPIDLDESPPFFVGVHPSAPRAYVASADDSDELAKGSFFVIDIAAEQVVGGAVNSTGVVSAALNADGSRLYVAGWDMSQEVATVGFVETHSLDQIAAQSGSLWDSLNVLTIPPLDAAERLGPMAVATFEGADLVYQLIAADDGSGGRLLLLNPQEPEAAASVDVGADPRDVEVSADGRSVVVANSGDSSLNIVDAATVSVEVVPLAESPVAVAMGPEGDLVFIVDSDIGLTILDLSTRTVAATVNVGLDSADVQVSSAGDKVCIASTGLGSVSVVELGVLTPSEWTVTSGRARPVCLAGQLVALLGAPRAARVVRQTAGQVRTPADIATGLSQVVPVSPGCPLGFSFLGLATVPDATAEILWLGGTCSELLGTDTVVIEESRRQPRSGMTATQQDAVPARHRRAVVAPDGTTQAEVRFSVPASGYAIIDQVSLAATSDDIGDSAVRLDAKGEPLSWVVEDTTDPSTVSLRQGSDGVVVENAGVEPAALSQMAAVKGDRPYELIFQGHVVHATAATPAVELHWVSDAETVLPETIERLFVDGFDHSLVQGVVPAAASSVAVRVVVPAGAALEVTSVGLRQPESIDVPVAFRSQAPGELTAAGARVVYDVAPRPPDPVPHTGLCPPTPPGRVTGEMPDQCCCPWCGAEGSLMDPEPAVTRAGRPAEIGRCQTCGARVVKVGGRLATGARQVPPPLVISKLATPAVSVERGVPAAGSRAAPPWSARDIDWQALVEPRPRLEPLSVTVIDGVGPSRAARLSRLGLGVVDRLAEAEPAAVAGVLPGVSTDLAIRFIDEARGLLGLI